MNSFLKITILAFSISSLVANAQQDTTKLFYAKKIQSNAFVELGSNIMQSYDKAGMDVKISINWLVQHKYYIGAAYNQLASKETFMSLKNAPTEITFDETKVKYQTLGLRFGYIFFPDQKIISLSPDLTVGWAGVRLNTDTVTHKINGAYISPAVKGVFNVSKYFRIGLELNYNIFAIKQFETDDKYFIKFQGKDLNGIGGGIFFRIGSF